MSNELAEREEGALAPQKGTTTQDLMRLALQQGAGIEQLRELMQMQREQEAYEARKAFVKAMSDLKSDPIIVEKRSKVGYETKQGGKTAYSHANLADICEAAVGRMAKHGLSHHWNTEQEGGSVQVSCVITHEQGHSQSVTLSAPPDSSGGKNNIQAVGSTVSYLERYTLAAALGIAARDTDDDGAAAEPAVSANQLDTLKKLAERAGADANKFLEYMSGVCGTKLEKLDDIPASKFETARGALQQKVDAAKRAASKQASETKES